MSCGVFWSLACYTDPQRSFDLIYLDNLVTSNWRQKYLETKLILGNRMMTPIKLLTSKFWALIFLVCLTVSITVISQLMTKVILKWHSYKILSLDKDEIEFKMRLIEVAYFLQVKTHFSEHHRLTLSSKTDFEKFF